MSDPLAVLSIVTPSGTRTVAGYTLPSRARAFAAQGERARGGGVRVVGDALEQPSAYEVRAELPAASLALAYDLAYDVVDDAEAATSVGTHEGTFAVRALVAWDMRPVAHDTVGLTLRWLPTGSVVAPRVPFVYASETTPTVDSTTPTADTMWEAPGA